MLASILLEEGNNNILNKKRFYDEFDSGEIAMPRKNPKPEDYEKLFAGDTDDNFKIGISVTKKSLKVTVKYFFVLFKSFSLTLSQLTFKF